MNLDDRVLRREDNLLHPQVDDGRRASR